MKNFYINPVDPFKHPINDRVIFLRALEQARQYLANPQQFKALAKPYQKHTRRSKQLPSR